MPRGPGKKENYNFDYSRFNGLDSGEEAQAASNEEGDGDSEIPVDIIRQLPGELQEAFRLLRVSRETGDERAQLRANELAMRAVERGGPEMKQRFQQEVMKQMAKHPEAKSGFEELLSGRVPGQAPAPAEESRAEELSRTIETLHVSMQAGAATAARQLEALRQQQEALEQLSGPEDFARFMAGQGLSEEDLQRALSGDEDLMRQAVEKALGRLEAPGAAAAMDKVDAMLSAVDSIHSQLHDLPGAAESRPKLAAREAPVGTAAAAEATGSAKPAPKIAEHRVQYQKDAAGRVLSVELRCALPGVGSMAAIEVDVSERHLRLRTLSPAYVVSAGPFPALLDAPAARAKFSRKREELTITVPAQP